MPDGPYDPVALATFGLPYGTALADAPFFHESHNFCC